MTERVRTLRMDKATTRPVERAWDRYFLFDLGESAAIFDPVRLETVYLDAAETRAVREGDDGRIADTLSEYGFTPGNGEAVDLPGDVVNHLAHLGISGQ
ncbi:hypothetical protein G3M58_84580, partial [Streptomyces sp. SID7499]|nr:hypothetical protein [Streptomyces sp. SID7499]